jgi:hypothetical protein
MSVCVYSVLVLFCVLAAALRQADPPSNESYRLCIDSETENAAKAQKNCRATDIQINFTHILPFNMATKES